MWSCEAEPPADDIQARTPALSDEPERRPWGCGGSDSSEWRWRSSEGGSEFGFHREFREIDSPRLIRNTQRYDAGDVGGSMGDAGEAMITVTLVEHDGATTMTTVMDFGSREARAAAVSTGMTRGMEASYKLPDQLLAQGSRR